MSNFLALGQRMRDIFIVRINVWKLPSIAYLDYDHEQRLFLNNLTYETRDLSFWKDSSGFIRCWATMGHLKQIQEQCNERGITCNFTSTDLMLTRFCDQNCDASYTSYANFVLLNFLLHTYRVQRERPSTFRRSTAQTPALRSLHFIFIFFILEEKGEA